MKYALAIAVAFALASWIMIPPWHKTVANPKPDVQTFQFETVEAKAPEPMPDSVSIDLNAMEMTLWKDGEQYKFEVLSKGNEESTWRTPRGEFEALWKAGDHFSSLGLVWMPNSIQFEGDFFIHGWPYYPDGTPVEEGYSGGCIRMSVEDMEEIYSLIDIGMPIEII